MSAIRSFQSVIEVAVDEQRWWRWEASAIRAALATHCAPAHHSGSVIDEVPGDELVEVHDPAALRTLLRAVAPQLSAFTDRVRRAFDEQRACAVVIPEVSLAEFDDNGRRQGMCGFAALLGNLPANHPGDAVVWDVRDRGEDRRRIGGHSKTSAAAAYHTDAGYLRVPPRFFLLYAMRAAACGGGESLLRDGRIVLEQLGRSDTGRAAIEALSQTLPRRIPTKFRPVADYSEDGFQYSPVISELPLWRWGKYNTSSALRANPQYATSRVWQALETVTNALVHGPGELRPVIPTDGVIVIDNHIAMHGRTGFTDPNRHLLRIRFHDPAHPTT
jgi:alpha-ketoglutarate-dependent taurine dioxygenase